MKKIVKLFKQWPIIIALVWFVMTMVGFSVDSTTGAVICSFLVAYIIVLALLYSHDKSLVLTNWDGMARHLGFLQNTLLTELSVPYAVMLDDGKIVWANSTFTEIFNDDSLTNHYLSNYIQELNRSVFPKGGVDTNQLEVEYAGKDYIVVLTRVDVPRINGREGILGLPKGREYFVTITMQDVTELHYYIRENDNQKLVSGLIYFDNYEEVMEHVEEVRQSLLIALIDRKVNQYLSNFDGIVKKMERDKYFFVVKQECFREMAKHKFAILEDVKNVNVGNTMPVTLSIGMGLFSGTYAHSYSNARVAIDLALARGGDQAVVKDGNNITYYGGKREQTARNTRVKARVKAEALREFIMSKEQVIVMGHRLADMDSFGAAVGIYRAAKVMEKKAHVVLNEITTSVRPFYEDFRDSAKYEEDMFITSADVHDYMNDNTLVVVVDTNRPVMTDCPELLKMAKTVVVFDHHRQTSDVIENTVLSYIEPFASSSCEMVAEMLQYIADDIRITNIEANSMYAGIMIDTSNFMNRTGVRTFEAAAFLRRCGADITHVRKVSRDDLDWYRAKSQVVSGAEIYREEFAIAGFPERGIESPTIVGAQAANDLLNIKGIKASFVLTEYAGKIHVSARAIDEVNVQVIMERLGGGGHINIAGAQFQHTDMEEAIKSLKQMIDLMIAEGDI